MEALVFCGIQGSGKTTFYVRRLLRTHVGISQRPSAEEGFDRIARVTVAPDGRFAVEPLEG